MVFADAIPLLAVPLKFLTAHIDTPVQYFGAWLLICFVLQGVFASKLLKAVGISGIQLYFSSLLFLIAPIFLYRMVIFGYGHFALSAHFLVLWALLIASRSEFKHKDWSWILCIALMVQFYFFFMVVAIYSLSMLVSLLSRSPKNRRRMQIHGVLVNALLVIATAYFAGYFIGQSPVGDGYTKFRTDLLAFTDSAPVDFPGWSQFIQDSNTTEFTYEGFAFLGVGTLALLPIVAWSVIRLRNRGIAWKLVALAVPLAVMAMSTRVTMGTKVLLEVSVHPLLLQGLNVIRASGRLIWPLVYALMVLCIVSLRIEVKRTAVAAAVLASLVSIQVFDQRVALGEFRERFETEWEFPVISGQQSWKTAVDRSPCIAIYPTPQGNGSWEAFSYFALQAGRVTNAAYVSRPSASVIDNLNHRIVRTGTLSDKYVDCVIVLLHGIGDLDQLQVGPHSTMRGRVFYVDEINSREITLKPAL